MRSGKIEVGIEKRGLTSREQADAVSLLRLRVSQERHEYFIVLRAKAYMNRMYRSVLPFKESAPPRLASIRSTPCMWTAQDA